MSADCLQSDWLTICLTVPWHGQLHYTIFSNLIFGKSWVYWKLLFHFFFFSFCVPEKDSCEGYTQSSRGGTRPEVLAGSAARVLGILLLSRDWVDLWGQSLCVCVCRLCECCLSESVCHMNIQCRSREKIQWFPFRVEVLITSMTSEPRLPLRGESIWVFLEPESIFGTLSWQNSSKLKSVIGIWAHFYLMCWNPFHILKERQMCLRKLFLNIVFKLNWRHFQHHLLKYSTPPTLIVLMLLMFLHINEYYLLLIDLIFEISQFIFQNIWYLTDKQWSVIGDD